MSQRGFTLIEMLVTLTLLGILASVVVPFADLQARHDRETLLRESLREIRHALDAYKHAGDNGRISVGAGDSGYPPTLRVLVDGVPDAQSPNGQRLYFLRRIPRDPLHPDTNVPAEETWGLRSYASPPEAPAAGRDVYDIHSLSEARALDGSRYRDW